MEAQRCSPAGNSVARDVGDSPDRHAAPRTVLPDPFGIVGTILDGRYLVERVVGGGGFGVAYRAQHLQFDSPVAIKALRLPEALPDDRRAGFIEGFSAEGKVLFRLGSLHPAIVRALETGSFTMADGRVVPYLVMEWLEGAGLDAELQARKDKNAPPLTLTEALALLHPVAEALGAAHEQGIAHRDVKPGNVFLSISSNGSVTARLLDFGLAKAMASSSSITEKLEDTSGGETPFTPAYGAPEQWLRRLGATGTWTDVHGLALTLVELMTGKTALDGNDRGQLMGACIDTASRPTPRAFGVDVTESVERVFRRALAVNPRERYHSVRQMWSELTSAAGWSPASQDRGRPQLLSIGMPLSGPVVSPTLSSPTDAVRVDDAIRNATGTMAVEGRSEALGTASARPAISVRIAVGAVVVTAVVTLAALIAARRGAESKGTPFPNQESLAPASAGSSAFSPDAPLAAPSATVVVAPVDDPAGSASAAPRATRNAPPKGSPSSPSNSATTPPATTRKPPAAANPTGLVQDEALLDRK